MTTLTTAIPITLLTTVIITTVSKAKKHTVSIRVTPAPRPQRSNDLAKTSHAPPPLPELLPLGPGLAVIPVGYVDAQFVVLALGHGVEGF